MKPALLVLVAVIVLTACGSGKSAASSTPAAAVPTPSPSPTAPPSKIGDTIFDTDQDQFTVYSLVAVPPQELWKPDAGMKFIAIDVKEKAGPNGLDANPYDFELVMDDDTRYQPYIGVKDPPLHAAKLGADQAVRGWVTFQIPVAATIARVVLSGSTDIFWEAA